MTEAAQRVLNIVYGAIDEVNETLPEGKKLVKDPQALLFDPATGVDSLSATVFIIALEQKIDQEFNRSLALLGDGGIHDEQSPLRSVASLTDRIESLLETTGNG